MVPISTPMPEAELLQIFSSTYFTLAPIIKSSVIRREKVSPKAKLEASKNSPVPSG